MLSFCESEHRLLSFLFYPHFLKFGAVTSPHQDLDCILLLSWLNFHMQKQKGTFQHSSFLAGGAAKAAGRLLVNHGILEVRFILWNAREHFLSSK